MSKDIQFVLVRGMFILNSDNIYRRIKRMQGKTTNLHSLT